MNRGLGALARDAVAWHDVECGSYDADLPLWRQLAEEAHGRVLEVGCGTGRVTLDLAARGNELTALDSDPALLEALAARARERGLDVQTVLGDARSLALRGGRFGLVIAPMQVVQLLGGRDALRRALASARRHLHSGGRLAAALADPLEGMPATEVLPPLPDVLERHGYVFSSTPVAVRDEPGGVVRIDRLRQAVSPGGELSESLATVRLQRLARGDLEAVAEREGFRALPSRLVPETRDHVGGAVAILEAV